MDNTRAIQILEAWVEVVRPQLNDIGNIRGDFGESLLPRADQTQQILNAVMGSRTENLLVRSRAYYRAGPGVFACMTAIGKLTTEQETQSILGPSAPQVSVDGLHPLIWSNVAQIWTDTHYAQAVQTAATFVNAYIQSLVNRTDVSDVNLMNQVFSDSEPANGSPRLRWPGDPQDLTVKAMRLGIRNFAVGCFSAIRNPSTHSTEAMQKQESYEQLAALSMLTRWVEKCDVTLKVE